MIKKILSKERLSLLCSKFEACMIEQFFGFFVGWGIIEADMRIIDLPDIDLEGFDNWINRVISWTVSEINL